MKNVILAVLFIGLLACNQSVDERIFGTWQVQDKYHIATYKIIAERSVIKGQVLDYDLKCISLGKFIESTIYK